MSNSVAHLNYPVGLLTADEIIMAGTAGNSTTSNKSYYLYTGDFYWTLLPDHFDRFTTNEVSLYYGSFSYAFVSTSYGLRPVVSLKPGTEFESGGNGTPTNQYVVKYN